MCVIEYITYTCGHSIFLVNQPGTCRDNVLIGDRFWCKHLPAFPKTIEDISQTSQDVSQEESVDVPIQTTLPWHCKHCQEHGRVIQNAQCCRFREYQTLIDDISTAAGRIEGRYENLGYHIHNNEMWARQPFLVDRLDNQDMLRAFFGPTWAIKMHVEAKVWFYEKEAKSMVRKARRTLRARNFDRTEEYMAEAVEAVRTVSLTIDKWTANSNELSSGYPERMSMYENGQRFVPMEGREIRALRLKQWEESLPSFGADRPVGFNSPFLNEMRWRHPTMADEVLARLEAETASYSSDDLQDEPSSHSSDDEHSAQDGGAHETPDEANDVFAVSSSENAGRGQMRFPATQPR